MAVEVRKRKSENAGTLLFRFNRKIKQSGLIREAKRRRFKSRKINRLRVKKSALYSLKRRQEITSAKKHGLEKKDK